MLSTVVLGLMICLPVQDTVVCRACDEAQQLVVAGDTAEAISLLRDEASRDPGSALLWGHLGVLLAHAATELERDIGTKLEAERALNRALALDPDNPRWLYGLAVLFRKRGMRTDADHYFDAALAATAAGRGDLTVRETAEMYAQRARVLEEYILDFEGIIAGDADPIYVMDWNNPTAEDLDFLYNKPHLDVYCIGVGHFCLNFVWPARFHEILLAFDTGERFVEERRERMRDLFLAAFRLDPSLEDAARGLLGELARLGQWDKYLEEAARHSRALPADGWPMVFLAAGYVRIDQPDIAEHLFQEGISLLAEEERHILNDITNVVSRDVERAYLAAAGERYSEVQEYLWTLANPFYLSTVNERRLEHLTRTALAELWYGAPRSGTRGYETDRGEILIRYGKPRFVRQVIPTGMLGDEVGVLERVNRPDELVVRATPIEPYAGGRWVFWTYETDMPSFVFHKQIRSRTVRHGTQTYSRQYADSVIYENPSSFHLPGLVAFPHQTVRFKGTRTAVEVDMFALLPGDRRAHEEPVPGKAGVFVIPVTPGQEVARIQAPTQFDDQPRVLSFRLPLEPGSYPYSLEASTDDGRIRARSRTSITVPDWSQDFVASDILLAHHIEPVRKPVLERQDVDVLASADLTFQEEAPIALYFELYNLEFAEDGTGHFRITLEIKSERDETAVVAVVRRLAELLGRGEPGEPISWERQVIGPVERVPEWFTVNLGAEPPGVYRLKLTAKDLRSGAGTTSERLFEIIQKKPN